MTAVPQVDPRDVPAGATIIDVREDYEYEMIRKGIYDEKVDAGSVSAIIGMESSPNHDVD